MEAADATDAQDRTIKTDRTDGTDANTATASKLVGHVIAGYRLMRVLEMEEASATLLGQHVEALDQQAAIKILQVPVGTPTASQAALRAQFNREAQALFALQHPHLLGIYALGVDVVTGNLYMVLPYPQGGALTQRLAAGALPLETAARYIAQVADAVDTAHALGMIHGDLTPASILFDGMGHLYVTGFRTGVGATIVSEKYVAPERLRGQAADPASDRYSLGVVLYEMVTGYAPFQGATPSIVALQHEHLPPPPPRALRPELPEQAEAVLLRALAKQPVERFASATALAAAFALSLGVESPPSDAATSTPAVPLAQPQPQPMVAAHQSMQPPTTPTAVSPSPATTPANALAAPSAAAPSGPAVLPATLAPVSPTLTPPAPAHGAELAISVAQPAPVAPIAPPIAPPATPPLSAAVATLSTVASASIPSAAFAPSPLAVVPVRTTASAAPSLTSNTAPSSTATALEQTAPPSGEPRSPAPTMPSVSARKHLVPPVLIRNVMLAIFALVLGTAIVAAVHVLGAVELLLTCIVIALFIYCGVILPGQAMRQEQRRARLTYQGSLGGEQPAMVGVTVQ